MAATRLLKLIRVPFKNVTSSIFHSRHIGVNTRTAHNGHLTAMPQWMHPPTTERRGRSEPPTWLTRLLALFQPRLQELVAQLNVVPQRTAVDDACHGQVRDAPRAVVEVAPVL